MARSFNGTTDQIATAGNAGFNLVSTFSISAWFYATASQNPAAIVSTTNDTPPFDGIFFYWGSGSGGNNHVSFLLGGASALGQRWANSAQALNTWIHGAITYDGSFTSAGMLLYLSGTQPATTTSGNPAGTIADRPFFIGSSNSNSDFFAGNVADVAVWNIVLTAGEIKGLSVGALPNSIRPTSLIRYWPLDGLQSPEPDFSGGVHNGTLTGTALAAGPPVMPFTPRWGRFVGWTPMLPASGLGWIINRRNKLMVPKKRA